MDGKAGCVVRGAESIARTSEALSQVCQHTSACGRIWKKRSYCWDLS